MPRVSRLAATFVGAMSAVALLATVIMIARNWPFARLAMEEALGRAVSGKAEIRSLQSRWFPHPGCTAEDVHLETARGSAFVKRRVIDSSYRALLTCSHRLTSIQANGLDVHVRRHADEIKGNETSVDQLTIDQSTFEVEPAKPGDQPLKIGVVHADFRPQASRPVAFHLILDYPKLRGRIDAHVEFGPTATVRDQTPISGRFHFEHADLSAFEHLEGILSAGGKFSGTLGRIKAYGETSVANSKWWIKSITL